jgi:hypothetical protein
MLFPPPQATVLGMSPRLSGIAVKRRSPLQKVLSTTVPEPATMAPPLITTVLSSNETMRSGPGRSPAQSRSDRLRRERIGYDALVPHGTGTYSHTHTHTHTHTHAHAHTHHLIRSPHSSHSLVSLTHTPARAHTCMHTHTQIYTHTQTHTQARAHGCTHTHRHGCTHPRAHTRISSAAPHRARLTASSSATPRSNNNI